ncbi:MAG: hypothetical protein JNM80_04700 [Phycisphaerae bacterium]|nr:hypothetical protein [Phycisphaerae bacterium]
MPRPSIEDEVRGNLLRQPMGAQTVADLALPRAFVDRVVDRIIRTTFQQRHRVVIPADPTRTYAVPPPSKPPEGSPLPGFGGARVVDARARGDELARRMALAEDRPARRSFAAFDPPTDPPAPGPESDAAAHVGDRLAADGLEATVVCAIELLGAAALVRTDRPADTLRRVGIPTDILLRRHAGETEDDCARALAARVASAGAGVAQLVMGLRHEARAWRPTAPGFRLALDSGQERARAMRLQATSGRAWFAVGAGGGLDVVRQVLEAVPDVRAIVSVEDRNAAGVAEALAGVIAADPSRLTFVVESLPVAQWAQDNARAGVVDDEWAWMVPRFASRGEEGSIFVPGESFLAEGLERAVGRELGGGAGRTVGRVVRSPLVFQGGNVLAYREANGRVVALVGEAEVHRNAALGMSATGSGAGALEALRVEMGADEAVVVPAVGFHTDFEVSVRADGSGRVVAFVNDTTAAARLVLERGLDGLAASGAMSGAEAGAAREELRRGRVGAAVPRVVAALDRVAVGPGHFPEALAEAFREGEADFGPANLEAFLMAVDVVAASLGAGPGSRPEDHGSAYLRALRRADAERRTLVQLLRRLGMRVVGLPSFAEADRGLNYVNAVHLPGIVLMPATGGFYAALDRAAAAIYERETSARVVPILCAESQRRNGAVHCSVG